MVFGEKVGFDRDWSSFLGAISFPLQNRVFVGLDPISKFKDVSSSVGVEQWVDDIFLNDHVGGALLNSAEVSMNKIIGFMIDRKGFSYSRIFDVLAERELSGLVSGDKSRDRWNLGALAMVQFYDRLQTAEVDEKASSKSKALATGSIFCIGMKLAYLRILLSNDPVLMDRIKYGKQLIADQLMLLGHLFLAHLIF